MKSNKVKVDEAKYVVDKDELDQVKGEFEEDDVVKVVDEAVEEEEEESLEESYTVSKGMITEMISDALADRVSSGDHSLKDNPSLPKLSGEDFLMRLVDAKYEDICKTIKVNGGTDSVDFTELIPLFSKALKEISLFEENSKPELAKLAVDIIIEEFGLELNDIAFDAEIVTDVMEIPNNDEVLYSAKNGEDLETLQGEIDKRRILNAIIQGGARKVADSFKMKKSEIAEIDTRLYNLYRTALPIGDLMYYSNDDDVEGIKTGSLSIVKNEGQPKITARGVNFPMLLLQLAKGVFELLVSEEATDRYEYIKSKADKPEFESDDVRLGLSIYDMMTKKINSDDSRVNYLTVSTIANVKVPEFHLMMKDILADTTDGDRYLKQISSVAVNTLKEYDAQESIHESGYVDETEIDSLDFDI